MFERRRLTAAQHTAPTVNPGAANKHLLAYLTGFHCSHQAAGQRLPAAHNSSVQVQRAPVYMPCPDHNHFEKATPQVATGVSQPRMHVVKPVVLSMQSAKRERTGSGHRQQLPAAMPSGSLVPAELRQHAWWVPQTVYRPGEAGPRHASIGIPRQMPLPPQPPAVFDGCGAHMQPDSCCCPCVACSTPARRLPTPAAIILHPCCGNTSMAV